MVLNIRTNNEGLVKLLIIPINVKLDATTHQQGRFVTVVDVRLVILAKVLVP